MEPSQMAIFKSYSVETFQKAILKIILHGTVPDGNIVNHTPWNRSRRQYFKSNSMEPFQKAIF